LAAVRLWREKRIIRDLRRKWTLGIEKKDVIDDLSNLM